MPLQRLDIRSLRYDEFGRSVLIDGRRAVIEIGHEALEAFCDRQLSPEEAMAKVTDEIKLLTRLAEFIPADDGKIHITTKLLLSDGMFETGE